MKVDLNSKFSGNIFPIPYYIILVNTGFVALQLHFLTLNTIELQFRKFSRNNFGRNRLSVFRSVIRDTLLYKFISI